MKNSKNNRNLLVTSAATIILPVVLINCGGEHNTVTSKPDNKDPNTYPAKPYVPPAAETPAEKALRLQQMALGEKIFNDVSLSASGKQSCATCHVEKFGFSGPSTLGAEPGGVHMEKQGTRVAPTLKYLQTNQSFHFGGLESAPMGGFFLDGRATSLQDQAGQPFLNPVEMANKTEQEVLDRLAKTSYVNEFKAVYGADIFTKPTLAYQSMTKSLALFQKHDIRFHPFTSKFDEYLRGKVQLTPQEKRGLDLFNSPIKGNCAACHSSAEPDEGGHPLFTDFSYDVLGVPRNTELTAFQNNTTFDLGLCKQAGNALIQQNTSVCGAFKVPTLRNVVLRQSFFHNGAIKTLHDAIDFYGSRDTNPEKWYPKNVDGTVAKFNDLPKNYHTNVNRNEVPYMLNVGDKPAFSEQDIADIVAFLNTLTDGFVPVNSVKP